MCGIVHKPTRRKDFDPTKFPNLSASSVHAIVTACEDVHIPHLATAFVLQFANEMADKKGFVMEVIPFAIYKDDKRLVTPESIEAEAAVMHLAMAGSVRRLINEELGKVGLIFELGHCCDIEMWEKSHELEAVVRSHDQNVYRADKLRALEKGAEETVPAQEFISQADGFNEDLVCMMITLANQEVVNADC